MLGRPVVRLSLLVLAGSALGGLARYWLVIVSAFLFGPVFPWGTLLINVLGSFVIGVVGAATDSRADVAVRAFVMVGICGGFTTFSSFSLQTLEMAQAGRMPAALAYVGMSVVLCVVSVWVGWALGSLEWG